ncbi:MAG TPA: DUF177 domain-containing protein [Polyangiaceae bacterium]|nr:DUF177 domain-containing protein [Polyangiaceae bacterium]
MSRQYVVQVAELEDGPRSFGWDIPVAWLERALQETEATPRCGGRADVTLTLTGREVLVRGSVVAPLVMPCVVTLDPVPIDVTASLFLLLTPPPPPARRDRRAPPETTGGTLKRRRAKEQAERRGRSGPRAAGGGGTTWDDDATLSDSEAGRDLYDGETVVLDEFLREAILLELPMAPRRSDLPLEPVDATAHRSAASVAASGPPVDPRLLPLAAIARRLRKNKE